MGNREDLLDGARRCIIAVPDGDCLARYELVVIPVNLRHAHSADTDKCRTFGDGGPTEGSRSFDRIGGHDNDHVVDRTQPGDVLN